MIGSNGHQPQHKSSRQCRWHSQKRREQKMPVVYLRPSRPQRFWLLSPTDRCNCAPADPDHAAPKVCHRPSAGAKEIKLDAATLHDQWARISSISAPCWTSRSMGSSSRAAHGTSLCPNLSRCQDEFFYKVVDARLTYVRDAAGRRRRAAPRRPRHTNALRRATDRLNSPNSRPGTAATARLSPFEGLSKYRLIDALDFCRSE